MATTVLYTYEVIEGETVCHAYGYDDEATARTEGESLHAQNSNLGFMVLPLESPPAPVVAADPAA